MDSLTIDIGELPIGTLQEGDFVEFLGPAQTLAAVPEEAGTIACELLVRLGPRHRRVFVAVRETEANWPGDN